MDQKMKYLLFSLLAIIIIIAGVFIYKNQTNHETQNGETGNKKESVTIDNGKEKIVAKDEDKVSADGISGEKNKEDKNESSAPETAAQSKSEKEKVEYPENSKEDLAGKLRTAIDSKNYELFADTLKKVYDSGWQNEEELKNLESELYVTGTDYFQKGNISEALRMAETISKKVFESWRFNYLRIICLEKLGRDELAKGNYDEAEKYAKQILRIEFRFEGTNLLCDVYIKKIENNLSAGDKEAALNNLNYIWDYEVDENHRNRLIELKSEIENK